MRRFKVFVRVLIFICLLVLGGIFYLFSSTAGAVIIPDFQVNPPDTAFIAQYTTDIAFQPNGNFVVVWEDRGWDHQNRQTYFQRYDSLGNRLGSAVLVSDINTGHFNQECATATDSVGNFAICYSSAESIGFDSTYGIPVFLYDIWVRLYDVNGQALTPSIQVDVDRPNTLPDLSEWYIEYAPDIARDKSGKVVVVWAEENNREIDPFTRKIFCQFFDSNGQKLGKNIFVSNPDSSEIPIRAHNVFPHIAISDKGHVMIIWEGKPDTLNQHPLGSVFSLEGKRLRKVFSALDLSNRFWIYGGWPDVAVGANNQFVLAFYANDKFISYKENAIVAMRLDSLGSRLNSPVVAIDTPDLVNFFTMPRVGAGPEGYLVVWSDPRTGDRNLMAQRFDYNDQLIGKNYRVNGITNSLTSPPDTFFGEKGHNWLHFNLQISSQGKVGITWADLRNYLSSDADTYAKILWLSEIGFYLPGDFNQDEKQNLAELIFLVNYVFKGGTKPFPLYQADVTGDCKVNLIDIVYYVNYLFKGGPDLKQGCA